MIANVLARALEIFETRVATPGMIQRAADLVRGRLESGFDGGIASKMQASRLPHAVTYAYDHSPFYRQRFEELGIARREIQTPEDLGRLPFTTGDEIRDWQRFLCVPKDHLAAVFTTAGTLGEPKQIYFSHRDLRRLTNFSALALRVRHPGPLKVLVALPMHHGLWIGSGSAPGIIRQAGGIPYPVGTGDPQETLAWMRRFELNTVISSPSYMANLTRRAEEQDYHRPLEQILLGGEKLTQDRRAWLRDYWGATIYDSYGTTEMGGAQSIMLPDCPAFYLNGLHLYPEIVEPETGEPADEGELVFTTLAREAMPLLRYRSGDRARWVECEGGLPLAAVQILGRLDDMLMVGGMHVYASVIVDEVTAVPGAEGRVQIRVTREEMLDHLNLLLEAAEASPEAVRRALFSAYPKIETNLKHGNLELDVRTGADLGEQIKGLKIVDERD